MIDYKFKEIIRDKGETRATIVAYEGAYKDITYKNPATGRIETINQYCRNRVLWTKEIIVPATLSFDKLQVLANFEISKDQTREKLLIQTNTQKMIDSFKIL